MNQGLNMMMNNPKCLNCACEFNILEEARFWTRIIKEHALFIKLGLPCSQPETAEEAQMFYNKFEMLEKRLKEAKKLEDPLLQELTEAVKDKIAFISKLISDLIQCNASPGGNFPSLLDHMRRETKHFLHLLMSPKQEAPLYTLLKEEVFWLDKMEEHIGMLIHWLDPSETELKDKAQKALKTFSGLHEAADHLKSMAETKPKYFNRVVIFTENAAGSTSQLKNFKESAYELANQCEMLSIAPTPLILDHVKREAEKFLNEINSLLPDVKKCNSTLNQRPLNID